MLLCFRSLCLPSTGETALETFSRDVEATWDVDTRPHGPRRSNRSPYRQPEKKSATSSSAKAKRIVVGGRGVRAAMYLRSQNCFLMIPRCEPGKNHPSHGGGLLRAQEEVCPRITKGHPVGWWGESAALNPAKEERAALENSTNPVYQVSSQHSSRHTGLGVKERRARLWATRQQCRFQQRDEILPCLRARELHVGQEDGNMRIKSIWAGLAMEKPGGECKPGVGNWCGGLGSRGLGRANPR